MQGAETSWIVHLCTRREWSAAQQMGEYRAPSLETEGFIHSSRPERILTVANRFYQGIPDQVLLWIDIHRVKPEIRWEETDEGIFPHIFGPLNLDAVRSVQDFDPDADGTFRIVPQMT